MPVIYCLLLMLTACTSHGRAAADGHLQPVNLPAATAPGAAAASPVPDPAAPAVPVGAPRSVR